MKLANSTSTYRPTYADFGAPFKRGFMGELLESLQPSACVVFDLPNRTRIKVWLNGLRLGRFSVDEGVNNKQTESFAFRISTNNSIQCTNTNFRHENCKVGSEINSIGFLWNYLHFYFLHQIVWTYFHSVGQFDCWNFPTNEILKSVNFLDKIF